MPNWTKMAGAQRWRGPGHATTDVSVVRAARVLSRCLSTPVNRRIGTRRPPDARVAGRGKHRRWTALGGARGRRETMATRFRRRAPSLIRQVAPETRQLSVRIGKVGFLGPNRAQSLSGQLLRVAESCAQIRGFFEQRRSLALIGLLPLVETDDSLLCVRQHGRRGCGALLPLLHGQTRRAYIHVTAGVGRRRRSGVGRLAASRGFRGGRGGRRGQRSSSPLIRRSVPGRHSIV